ncbi:MAG: hypothetical protein WD844_10045 [Thermoleophilaceae bacterium]
MEEAFGTVVVVVAVVAAVAAILSYVGSGRLYQGIGKGGLSLDEPDAARGPKPGSAAFRRESEAELRQMLEAKSYRRERRGEEPLDVEAELHALTRSPATTRDAELEEEVRQLVIAGNERRGRRGEEPLDVDDEVARQLRELGA